MTGVQTCALPISIRMKKVEMKEEKKVEMKEEKKVEMKEEKKVEMKQNGINFPSTSIKDNDIDIPTFLRKRAMQSTSSPIN